MMMFQPVEVSSKISEADHLIEQAMEMIDGIVTQKEPLESALMEIYGKLEDAKGYIYQLEANADAES